MFFGIDAPHDLSAFDYWRRVLRLWAYDGAVRATVTAWARRRAEPHDEAGWVGSSDPGPAAVPPEAVNALVPPVPGYEAPLIEFG